LSTPGGFFFPQKTPPPLQNFYGESFFVLSLFRTAKLFLVGSTPAEPLQTHGSLHHPVPPCWLLSQFWRTRFGFIWGNHVLAQKSLHTPPPSFLGRKYTPPFFFFSFLAQVISHAFLSTPPFFWWGRRPSPQREGSIFSPPPPAVFFLFAEGFLPNGYFLRKRRARLPLRQNPFLPLFLAFYFGPTPARWLGSSGVIPPLHELHS